MPGRIERGGRVVGRDSTGQFGFARCSTIQCIIHRELRLGDCGDPYLGCRLLTLGIVSSTKDSGFLEGEFEAAEKDGVQTVGFEGSDDRYSVTRPVAGIAPVNCQGHSIL